MTQSQLDGPSSTTNPGLSNTTKEATGLLNPRLSWSLGLLAPVVAIPVWIWMIDNRLPNRLGTASGMILIQLLAVSTYTDLTRRKILNAFTFSSILWAILLNLVATLVPRQISLASVATSDLEWLGAIGIGRCLSGLGICFAVMLFVFILSGRGAGDVKIAAAIGALLGAEQGLTALGCSYLAAGLTMILWSVWKRGPLTLIVAIGRKLGTLLFPTMINPPTPADQQFLQQGIPLAPFFAIGTLLVVLEIVRSP